jgi:hypothetical protein
MRWRAAGRHHRHDPRASDPTSQSISRGEAAHAHMATRRVTLWTFTSLILVLQVPWQPIAEKLKKHRWTCIDKPCMRHVAQWPTSYFLNPWLYRSQTQRLCRRRNQVEALEIFQMIQECIISVSISSNSHEAAVPHWEKSRRAYYVSTY